MNQIINYLFLALIIIITILTVINLTNNNYIKVNNIFLNILNKMRFITNFFTSEYNKRLSYDYLNEYILEGNRYVKESKSLYISIKLGLLFLVMLICFLLLGNVENDIWLPILITLIFLLLFVLPIIMSLINIAKRTNKIDSQKENKINFKLENLIILIEIVLIVIVNILLINKTNLNGLLLIDLIAIIIVLLLYKPIRIVCMKQRKRRKD